MNKKFLLLAILLIFTLAAFAGCAENGGASVTAPAPTGPAAALVPAEGWTQNKGYTYPLYNRQYAAFSSSISVTAANGSHDPRAYALNDQQNIKKAYADAVFGDITDITAGGMAAAEYTWTGSQDGAEIKCRYVYVTDGTNIYIIKCVSAAATFDADNIDYQAMIDSFIIS